MPERILREEAEQQAVERAYTDADNFVDHALYDLKKRVEELRNTVYAVTVENAADEFERDEVDVTLTQIDTDELADALAELHGTTEPRQKELRAALAAGAADFRFETEVECDYAWFKVHVEIEGGNAPRWRVTTYRQALGRATNEDGTRRYDAIPSQIRVGYVVRIAVGEALGWWNRGLREKVAKIEETILDAAERVAKTPTPE